MVSQHALQVSRPTPKGEFCPQGGCYPSMHCRWYPSMSCSRFSWWRVWYPSMDCMFPGPHPRGKFGGSGWGVSPGHTQGGSRVGSGPGPQPRGKLRGIWSEGSAPWCVCSRGVACSKGVSASRGVPALGGACSGGACSGRCGDPPMMATAVGSMHPTGMHSC